MKHNEKNEDLNRDVHNKALFRHFLKSNVIQYSKQISTHTKSDIPDMICTMCLSDYNLAYFFPGGKGAGEAGENRNYLASRMSAEVSEIIRVLQLTTYDEDEWDSDNLTVMRKNMGIIESKLQTALDWLNDPNALQGGVGEKSIRQILAHAKKVADRSLPNDADHLRKLSGN